MAIPVKKAIDIYNKYNSRLGDFAGEIDEFTLHAMRAEVRREMRNADDEGMGLLWVLISAIEDRLKHPDEALRAARLAAEAIPHHAMVLNNYGHALGDLGHTRDALAQFERALAYIDTMPSMRQTILVNIALARHQLGDRDAALDALAQAVHAANLDDATSVLNLLRACAALGEEDDAVEMLARFVALVTHVPRGDAPALAVIDAAPAELAPLIQGSAIAPAVEAVRARWKSPPPDEYRPPARIELAPDAWSQFAALAEI